MSRIIRIAAVGETLVLGSSGRLGSGFVQMLEAKNRRTVKRHAAGRRFDLYPSSETNVLKEIKDNFDIKYIYCFLGHSDTKSINPLISTEELQTIRNCLKFVNQIDGMKTFAYASSVLAAAPERYLSSLERSSSSEPLRLYSNTKRNAESLVRNLLNNSSLEFILLNRYTNLFGRRPFGSGTILSYLFTTIGTGGRVLHFQSPETSKFNFVSDELVHYALYKHISLLRASEKAGLRLCYIATRNCQTLGDMLKMVWPELMSSEMKVSFGTKKTFWDFFAGPMPLIAPCEKRNILAFKRMFRTAFPVKHCHARESYFCDHRN